jgi:anaerobic selenocysteine-containing dehydrogenase
MPTRVVHTVCTHDCPDSCGVLVTVDTVTGRAMKVAGDPAHPVTRGFLCGKVAKYLDRVYSPERLLYPMRRRAGVAKGPLPQGREAEAFERISWDEALTQIAAKLTAVAADHGSESILPYSYAGTIGQLGYGSMDRRFFARLGASQLDRTICSTAGSAALTSIYGVRLGTRPEDFAHAGLVIAWGANLHGNSIHLWPFVEQARRQGAKLVVIDPYRTRTAALADRHFAIRPGTDGMLALAMMHVLFRDGFADEAYLDACVREWRALKEFALLNKHSPPQAAVATGIATEEIEWLARAYGSAGSSGRKPAVLRSNYGIQRAQNGGTAMRAVLMLPLITGSWKQRGGGALLSMSGAFGFNSAALQRPDLAQRSPLGRPGRVVNMTELGEALTALTAPRVHALFVYNCNAAAIAPDSEKVLAGLRRDDLFTVVHEQFFTDTTDYADIVLPATTFLEHTELMGSYGHTFLQLSEQAIAAPGEARTNVAMFAAMAQQMGFEDAAFHDTEETLMQQALASEDPALRGITLERLRREQQIELALPVNVRGESLPFSDASWFRTPSGKAEVLPLPAYVAAEESFEAAQNASAKLLQFLPRKADNFMNTTFANIPLHQQMERRTAGILEIHADDAAARSISNGDAVNVHNARGELRLVALVSDAVAAGVVAARLDWQKLSVDGHNVNALTSQRLTDIGGGATFYSTLVEVSKIDAACAD